ncbi:PaaI family thioesterase [Candidatus Accumulibacter sp. ACC007]|uniref:PaaI family thioesterase n=1 Tax=Candidatus Accumulibacter sp. ACC007 TaxID=2823333 RepID=UPI0025BCAEED|nr:PaaI family thioesterase [Candidatus Accumulibacter sp. ACC007]
MPSTAFQDCYPDDFAHCYGCGKNNEHGHHLKSHWDDSDGDTTVARFTPQPYHTGGVPGNVYGGLIASLLDCHGAGSAAAAACKAEGREMGSTPPMRFVTASLKVDYLRPTPIDAELEVRGEIVEVKPRKVTVSLSLSAHGEVCARGHMIAVRLPDSAAGKQ